MVPRPAGEARSRQSSGVDGVLYFTGDRAAVYP